MEVKSAEQGKIILETDRLILREMKQSDLDALCRTMCDEEGMREAYVYPFSPEQVQGWLDRHLK